MFLQDFIFYSIIKIAVQTELELVLGNAIIKFIYFYRAYSCLTNNNRNKSAQAN